MVHGDGYASPAEATTINVNRVATFPQIVVDLDELRCMRTEIIAVKASVDHLLQVLTILITTAEIPAG